MICTGERRRSRKRTKATVAVRKRRMMGVPPKPCKQPASREFGSASRPERSSVLGKQQLRCSLHALGRHDRQLATLLLVVGMQWVEDVCSPHLQIVHCISVAYRLLHGWREADMLIADVEEAGSRARSFGHNLAKGLAARSTRSPECMGGGNSSVRPQASSKAPISKNRIVAVVLV